MSAVIYSGDQLGWLSAVANLLMDRGAEQVPLSIADLHRRVPGQVSTARNDGHVTAAENGLDRDDYRAGWRIWVDGTVQALRKAGLVDGPDDALRWTGAADAIHKVRFYRRTYTIRDRVARREQHDRYMLGDPEHDWTEPSLGSEGRVLRGDTPPLPVKVAKGRVYATVKDPEPALEIHPLALAIPPMTPAEQQQVRVDIERHGVKVPILMFPDNRDLAARGKPKMKVLDGRHRTYFASVTGQPVVLEEFKGTEAEARDHVASLNLHRRHLTRQQRALAAERLYGEQARKDAERAHREGSAKGGKAESNLSQPFNGHSEGKKAHERVWEMAGGEASGFSKADAKAAADIAKAPKTAAKVDAGEIQNTSKAKREADAEIAGTSVAPPTVGEAVTDERSANEYVGHALHDLKRAAQVYDIHLGNATPAEIDARLREIVQIAQTIRRQIGKLVPESRSVKGRG